jgi:hypothetical protein
MGMVKTKHDNKGFQMKNIRGRSTYYPWDMDNKVDTQLLLRLREIIKNKSVKMETHPVILILRGV